MMVLSLQEVTKSYGEKLVLDQVSFTISTGERVGLVGANGAGKSTIMKILIGDLEADSGAVTLAKHTEWGYLPQVIEATDGQTIAGLIQDSQRELRQMERRMEELAGLMGTVAGLELDRVMEEYGELSARFEQRGGYELEYRTEQVLEGLKLGDLDTNRPLATLSGGQRTRVGLAALLISAPDLLLLDEPTNHLDFATMAWLEEYVSGYQGALLVISHDRQFLNRTVTKILELDEYKHQVKEYAGDYDAYITAKRLEREQWEARYERQQEEIKELRLRIAETARQVGHNRAMSDHNKMAYNGHGRSVQNAISRNVRNAETRLERIMADPVPPPPQPMRFTPDFDPARLKAKTALMVSQLAVSYGEEKRLFDGLQFSLNSKERMLILGPNGAGKSTLLHVLAGKRKADGGSIAVAPEIAIGYLEQGLCGGDPKATVLEAFADGKPGYKDEHVTKILSYHLFNYEELSLKVGSLSPGQHRKLMLAKLMASGANLLLIDEPTNHLSFDLLEEFEQALDRFPGPVIVVSHDRWFINRFRGSVWTLEDGQLLAPATDEQMSEEEAEQAIAKLQELVELGELAEQQAGPENKYA